MRSSGGLSTLLRFIRLFLSLILPLGMLVAAYHTVLPAAYSQQVGLVRYGGYGISVGPWLPSRPDLLDQMQMDWVKVYQTAQLRDYPNQRVLYRIEIDYWPNEAWVRGLYDLARELGAAGVDAVEIGNEPNLGAEWTWEPPNPQHFTEAVCAAYRVFKEVAPAIIVVSGGLAPTAGTSDGRNMDDMVFAQQALDAGLGNCFDAFGYHPYGFDQPPEANPSKHPFSFRRAELMYDLLLRNGVRGKQMWITEFGWVRNPAEEGINCANDPLFADFQWMVVSSQTQAEYIARAFSFADRNWPWAGPLFLWNLNWNTYPDSENEPPCSHLRWYSILDRDGTPLPAVPAIAGLPKRPPVEYRPEIGAVVNQLTRTAEAGCVGLLRLGDFTLYNAGYPGEFEVEIKAANAAGRPFVWTSVTRAGDGDTVVVFVDARGAQPGLYLIAINLRAFGAQRMTSRVVRGWLLVHYPTTPECVQRFGG